VFFSGRGVAKRDFSHLLSQLAYFEEMTSRWLLAFVLTLGPGCSTSLRLLRPTPPQGSMGTVRTLSVDVRTDVGKAATNSVVGGLFRGEVPVPVPFDGAVRAQLVARLEALGYAVCPSSPCGDGAMSTLLLESEVNTAVSTGEATARVRAHVVVTQHDGTTPYDFTFWATRSGSMAEIPSLVRGCAEAVATRFDATLRPGSVIATIPLEDGGPLAPGVNQLLAEDFRSAAAYFSQLTEQQPELAGAWYDLGVAWEAQGAWGEAASAYEKAAGHARKRLYLDALDHARSLAPPAPSPMAVPPQIIR
jgi:Tetratricopeptide repeat